MHPSQANFPSYKNMVTGEQMDECDSRSDQKRQDEIFWEPRKMEKGLRIEEWEYGDYECPEIILQSEEKYRIS